MLLKLMRSHFGMETTKQNGIWRIIIPVVGHSNYINRTLFEFELEFTCTATAQTEQQRKLHFMREIIWQIEEEQTDTCRKRELNSKGRRVHAKPL